MTDWDRSAEPERPPPSSVYPQLGAGILLTFALHLAAGAALLGAGWLSLAAGLDPLGQALGVIGGAWILGVGLAQWVYLLPAVAATWVIRRPLALGILIGGGLTFVMNSACYGVMLAVTIGNS